MNTKSLKLKKYTTHKFLLMNSWSWSVTKKVTKLKENPLRQLYFISISFVW